MTTRNKIPGRAKYGNRKVEIDGIKFDSKKEAKRYGELKMMEKAKLLFELTLQETFEININGVSICKYRADFCYWQNGKKIIEDCKGMKTRIYSLKKKLMKACLNIEIREV